MIAPNAPDRGGRARFEVGGYCVAPCSWPSSKSGLILSETRASIEDRLRLNMRRVCEDGSYDFYETFGSCKMYYSTENGLTHRTLWAPCTSCFIVSPLLCTYRWRYTTDTMDTYSVATSKVGFPSCERDISEELHFRYDFSRTHYKYSKIISPKC